MFASRTWANFISHRARRDISQYATAYYFTFCDSKIFHLYYRPIVNRKGVTHYTLQSKTCEKEYEQNCSYSFCYFFGRCCPLRVILSGVRPRFHLRFARCCFAVRLRYASLRMTRRTQSKPEGRTAMPFGSRREIKTCFMEGTLSGAFLFC